jgi:hypothetical protein
MARPTKKTDAVKSAFLAGVRLGAPIRTAARAAGVSDDSIARWRETDPSFADAIKKAEADAVLKAVGLIRAASAKNWTAAAWFLERRHPEDWAKRDPDVVSQIAALAPKLAAIESAR